MTPRFPSPAPTPPDPDEAALQQRLRDLEAEVLHQWRSIDTPAASPVIPSDRSVSPRISKARKALTLAKF
ncbi:MAG: hypothetical protein ACO4CG_13475, partial [Prochlorothrix sp.]